MSVRLTTYGLEGLYISDISGAGIPGCKWSRLGVNLEGTFSLAQDDTEETEINIEESDNPIVQILKAGKRSFTTSIPSLDFGLLQQVFGATKGSAPIEVDGEMEYRVSIPDSAAYIFKSFKIVPSVGASQIYFPKGQISAKIAGNLTKDSTVNVELTVTALTPDTERETAMMIDLKAGSQPGYWLGSVLNDDGLTNVIDATDDLSFKITVDDGTATDVVVDNSGLVESGGWDAIVEKINAALTTYSMAATCSIDQEEFRLTVTSNNIEPSTAAPSKVVIAAPTAGVGILDATGANYFAFAGGESVEGY